MKNIWSLMCFSLYIAASYSKVIEVDQLQSTIKDLQQDIGNFKDDILGAISDRSNDIVGREVLGVIKDGALVMIYNVSAEGYRISKLLGIPRPVITEEEFENIYPCKASQGNSNLDVQCVKFMKYSGSWEEHYRKCLDIGGKGLLEVTKDRLPLLQQYLKRFDGIHFWIGGRSNQKSFVWPSGRNVSLAWGWRDADDVFPEEGGCMRITSPDSNQRYIRWGTFSQQDCGDIYYSLCEMTPPTDIIDFKTLPFMGISDEIEEEFEQTSCGGEYNSRNGTIRFPVSGGHYQNNEHCTWIIRGERGVAFTFESIATEEGHDFLTIREGDSIRSKVIGIFSGESVSVDDCTYDYNSFCVITYLKNEAHIVFTSDVSGTGAGFVLHWEPFFCGSDYNTSRGMIRHQFAGQDNCFWNIRAAGPITITFVTLDLVDYEHVKVGDGPCLESKHVQFYRSDSDPTQSPFQTTSHTACISARTSKPPSNRTVFEIHWEPSGGE